MAISTPTVVGLSSDTGTNHLLVTLSSNVPASTLTVASVLFVFMHTVNPNASGFVDYTITDNSVSGPGPGYFGPNAVGLDGPRVGSFCHSGTADPLTDSPGLPYIVTNALTAGDVIDIELDLTADYVRATLVAVTGMGRAEGQWNGMCSANNTWLAAEGGLSPYDIGWEGDCNLDETVSWLSSFPTLCTMGLYHVTQAVYTTGGLTFNDGGVVVLDSYSDVESSVASGVIGYIPITPPQTVGDTFDFGATPSIGVPDSFYSHVDGIWMQPGLGIAHCAAPTGHPVFNHRFRVPD